MLYNNNVLKTYIDSFFIFFTDMASKDVDGSGSRSTGGSRRGKTS